MFAWQQGGDGDSAGALNAIAKAAEVTQREPGGREWMALDFSFGDELDTPLPTDGDAKGNWNSSKR